MKELPTFIRDSREQLFWTFPEDVAKTVVQALPSGDYSILGLTDKVAIERKTLSDFVGCCVQSWRRFRRELERLQSYESAVVAVEANVEDVFSKKYRSALHPHAVLGRAQAIFLDY